jgi:hypothetical protein
MSTRSVFALAVAASLFATCALADDSAAKASRPVADASCADAIAGKRVYPHPHKGYIVKPSLKAQSACTVAQPKSFDTSI